MLISRDSCYDFAAALEYQIAMTWEKEWGRCAGRLDSSASLPFWYLRTSSALTTNLNHMKGHTSCQLPVMVKPARNADLPTL